MAPDNREDYRALFDALENEHLPIAQMIHLWSYGSEEIALENSASLMAAQTLGIYSLLYLVQTLADRITQPIPLLVVSQQMQAVLPDEAIAPAHASILGLVKTIPQEMPNLNCRHVDLAIGDSLKSQAEQVLQELQVSAKVREVAYRRGQRWIARLAAGDWSSSPPPSALPADGFYLISGGLGDVGMEIAKYLLQQSAHVLIVGRTPLPDRFPSSDAISDTAGTLAAQRLQAYQALEQLAGTVHYAAVDIADLSQLQQVVAELEERWGKPLQGIFHLAGIYQERLLVDETPETFAATLHPKVLGSWTLHQLLKDRPDSVFISFSSIASCFGGAMIGAYAAANHFLDSFVHYQQRSSRIRSYCLNWSTWNGLGVSRQSQVKGLQSRGYFALTAKQGLQSLLAALQRPPAQVVIGLDGSHANIRRYQETAAVSMQQLTAYYTSPSDAVVASLPTLKVSDRFQVVSTCDTVQLDEMPLTPTGQIDREYLETLGHQGRSTSSKIAPRTALEQQLAELWQAVLGVSQIGVEDNFFELGGNSLLAVQLISQISDTLQTELPLSALLEAQTVAQLAGLLQQQSRSPLVAIQPQGERSPLFWVHPIGGTVLCYRELSQHLGPAYPFYGLQSLSLVDGTDCLTTVEEMATAYIAAIRTVQPEGPYWLGGWSLGGLVALEMAQQLQAMGQAIALLVLIDSHAGNTIDVPEQIDHALLLSAVMQDLAGLSGRELTIPIEHLQTLTPDEQLQYVKDCAQSAQVLPPEFGFSQMRQLWDVFQTNHHAWYRYVPQQYDGKTVLFWADQQPPQVLQSPAQFWADLIPDLQTHQIAGDHYAIVRAPQIGAIAEQLKRLI
jgi:thioesterase domain-containing protein/NAD(P)-dependent dehydrogenase (short-subunit alcohol dehydrogenase family)/acyl carrier protein